ncbi:hypothetical protein WAI453_001042 [Rhynchosporium graminicola]
MGDKGVMQMVRYKYGGTERLDSTCTKDEEDEDDADAAISLNPVTVYFGTESTSTGPLE